MKRYFEGATIDDLYLQLIKSISEEPEYIVRPRGMEVKETTGVVAVLTNPLACLTRLSARKLNYAFTIAEKLEYLSGQHDQARLSFYNPNFANFQNSLGFLDGAYAPRIAYWREHVYETLKSDPDSRQAVYTIYGPQDRHATKDVPCTLTHQFLLRNGKLNMIASMRSNDLLWGFPLDVNAFCFLLEVYASWLGVEVGTYTHIAGSMHLYTEREEQLTTLLKDSSSNDHWNPRFDQRDMKGSLHDIDIMWALEHTYRTSSKNYLTSSKSDNATLLARIDGLEGRLPLYLLSYWKELKSFIDRRK